MFRKVCGNVKITKRPEYLGVFVVMMACLLSILLASSAHALIGESFEEIVARYGQPKDHSDHIPQWYGFQWDHKRVVVTIWNAVSHCETYQPEIGEFSLSDIKDILARNAADVPYKHSSILSAADRDVYECDDGILIAYVPKTGQNRGCLVATKQYIAFRSKLLQKKEN